MPITTLIYLSLAPLTLGQQRPGSGGTTTPQEIIRRLGATRIRDNIFSYRRGDRQEFLIQISDGRAIMLSPDGATASIYSGQVSGGINQWTAIANRATEGTYNFVGEIPASVQNQITQAIATIQDLRTGPAPTPVAQQPQNPEQLRNLNLSDLSATPSSNGIWLYHALDLHSQCNSIVADPNSSSGALLMLDSRNNAVWIYDRSNNTRWRTIGQRGTHEENITRFGEARANAIRSVLEDRRNRGWVSPGTSLNSMAVRRNTNGTFQYYSPNGPDAHGDYLDIVSDGCVCMLGANPTDRRVYLSRGDGSWQNVGMRIQVRGTNGQLQWVFQPNETFISNFYSGRPTVAQQVVNEISQIINGIIEHRGEGWVLTINSRIARLEAEISGLEAEPGRLHNVLHNRASWGVGNVNIVSHHFMPRWTLLDENARVYDALVAARTRLAERGPVLRDRLATLQTSN